MNDLVEKLLQPVSPDQPGGPDLSYDPQFEELETLLRGKPEVDIGSVKKPAEPPDWPELRSKSGEFLRKSKHLRAATMWTCAMLRTDGVPGFASGLELVLGLLERYWDTMHPLLDPDDNNDPTQRLNILSALTTPRGVAGWLAILDYLHTAPVCAVKGAPPVTFDLLDPGATPAAPAAEGAPPPPDPAKLRVILSGPGADQAAATFVALQGALETVRKIDEFLTTKLGAGGTISFDVLQRALNALSAALKPHLPGAAQAGATEEAAAAGGSANGGAVRLNGPIQSREEVVRALEGICKYYEQAEPSSPVPYLLRRAQKLAAMNFVQAMQELNLANVDALRPSMGSAIEEPAPPAG